jgi:hypothetical protein
VETLKEFRNNPLGQQIIVHTDHANLTYKNLNSERVIETMGGRLQPGREKVKS